MSSCRQGGVRGRASASRSPIEFARLCRQAGVPAIRLRDARHTVSSLLAAAGVPDHIRATPRARSCGGGLEQASRAGHPRIRQPKLRSLPPAGSPEVPRPALPRMLGGQSLGIAGGVVLGLVLLDQTVQWIVDRIWWIGATVAVCFALAVAASTWRKRGPGSARPGSPPCTASCRVPT